MKKRRDSIDQPQDIGTKSKDKETVEGGLTEQVDNAFVISSKEPDGVFEEEHEGGIDDSISQLVGIDLRGKQSFLLQLLHGGLST